MRDLQPIPFATLVGRLRRELAEGGDVYLMPRRSWWTPDDARDLSLEHLGHRIATPFGPASGPHTQLAQNLVAAWLGGARFMELKTVQVLDELEIPRPCIHVPHVGYNVEWSQELAVEQSAAEYVAGWWLIHLLASDRGPGLWPGPEVLFDVSVGYDLEGIRSDKVQAYLDTMRDASPLLDRLRADLPPDLRAWADVEVPAQVSDSVTISTFHGCPADEIEAIAAHLLDQGWHTVIKLNPTLLGHARVRALLDRMGYDQITLREDDFAKDLAWDQLLDFVPRLAEKAAARGLGFGVKFTNTLVCHSDEPPFEQEEMYLSGPPLHVLAFTLAARFHEALPSLPITFSAGIDAKNAWEVVQAGIGPVTSCTDLLKARGYQRLGGYLRGLQRAMDDGGAADLASFTADADAALARRAAGIADDPRYHRAAHDAPPRKIGSHLVLLDCLTCDKCLPVCPNLANFAFDLPQGSWSPGRATWGPEGLEVGEGETVTVEKRHQIGNLADACNLCGHCDTWCPEDGGPYLVKPTLFLSEDTFEGMADRDGFVVVDDGAGILWRRAGQTYAYRRADGQARFETGDAALLLEGGQPVAAEGTGEIDLTVPLIMGWFLDAFGERAGGWR